MTPRTGRYLRRGERSLWVLGALLCGCWAGVWLEGRVYQAYQNNRLNHLLRSGSASADLRSTRGGRPINEGILGRLDIPRVGLSVLVLNGVDATTLLLGAGRLPGTPPAGAAGNLVIAGHRDTFFRPLRDIRKDDRIRVTTLHGTYSYVVQWAAVVDQSDTGVLANTQEPSLTLVTCYPFQYVGPAPQRFIVRARLAAGGTSPPAPGERVRDDRPSPFLAHRRVSKTAPAVRSIARVKGEANGT